MTLDNALATGPSRQMNDPGRMVLRRSRAALASGALVIAGVTFTAPPAASSGVQVTAVAEAGGTRSETVTHRDPLRWPFTQHSIWNMPIGSNAVYVPAGLQTTPNSDGATQPDEEFIGMDPGDPLKTLTSDDDGVLGRVHVPPGMHWDGSWNGSSAFLAADGDTVWQGQPLRLSPGADPAWADTFPHIDPVTHRWLSDGWAYSLRNGDGMYGAHGGSHLSSIGGTIRRGELTGTAPIRHVLKLNVFAKRFLYYDGGSGRAGSFRWPAASSDSYASPTTYGGTNPKMKMGALLALRPATDLSWIRSPQARKIAEALRDYGAYVVDDTFSNQYGIGIDIAAINEWKGGSSPSGGQDDPQTKADLQRIYTSLAIVDNNGPGSIGGGGTPRRPLAPPFGASLDSVAPRVVATSPRNRATGVRVRADIRATFSEAMRAASLTRANVRLYVAGTGSVLGARVRYDRASRQVTVDPRARLAHHTTYKVVIGPAVTDLAGNGLDQDPRRTGRQAKVLRFTTR